MPTRGHGLLEKRSDGTERALLESPRNSTVVEYRPGTRVRVIGKVPEALIELFVSKFGKQLARAFESIGNKSGRICGAVDPTGRLWRKVPRRVSSRLAKYMDDPVLN